ncbi:MAG: class I SAM-dependent RNA methyltransferase [Rhizomicrobium sp.]
MSLCIHFGTCGGCAHQDLPADVYRAMKRDLVVQALARNGLADASVEDIVEVPPASRRRATFKAAKRNGAVAIGFHAARSHDIVDMHACKVLTPALFALTGGLREMLTVLLRDGGTADVDVTETDTGFDVALDGWHAKDASARAELARWATRLGLARVTIGRDTVVELGAPRVMLGKARVTLPPRAFLQPTGAGEAALQSQVLAAAKGARHVADLFSGCGTFALPLAEQARVHAVERDGAMLEALASAARGTQGLKPVTTEPRDLFRLPLTPPELKPFDTVVLDPPRAGAAAQIAGLAKARVRRVIYVSCDPGSFARDACVMRAAGYTMSPVVPVDQFLWSSHIELVAAFRAARGT